MTTPPCAALNTTPQSRRPLFEEIRSKLERHHTDVFDPLGATFRVA